jgi:hypothetical protein
LVRSVGAPITSKRQRSSGTSWSACSTGTACRPGARSTTGSPDLQHR